LAHRLAQRTNELIAKIEKNAHLTQSWLQGAKTLEKVSKAVAVEDGDEPPPLA
jgi:hypothetical protein